MTSSTSEAERRKVLEGLLSDWNTKQRTEHRQAILFIKAEWASDACASMERALEAAVASTTSLCWITLDYDGHPDVVDMLEVTHLPMLLAFEDGLAMDSLKGKVEPQQVQLFLHRLVHHQLVTEDRALLGDARLFPSTALSTTETKPTSVIGPTKSESSEVTKKMELAAQCLRQGQVEYAAKIYESSLLATVTDRGKVVCLGGVILARCILGQASRVRHYIAEMKQLDNPHLSVVVYELTTCLSDLDGVLDPKVSLKSLAPQLTVNPRNTRLRVQRLLLLLLAGQLEELMTEVIKIATFDQDIARKALDILVPYVGGEYSVLTLKTRHFLKASNLMGI